MRKPIQVVSVGLALGRMQWPGERCVRHFKGFPNEDLELALEGTSLEKRKK